MKRSDLETLLVWLIPAIVITALIHNTVSHFVGDLFSLTETPVTQSAGEMSWLDLHFSYGQKLLILSMANSLSGILIQTVAAVWLYFQARRSSGRAILWALAGLTLKYWAIVFFLFACLPEKFDGTAKTDQDAA